MVVRIMHPEANGLQDLERSPLLYYKELACVCTQVGTASGLQGRDNKRQGELRNTDRLQEGEYISHHDCNETALQTNVRVHHSQVEAHGVRVFDEHTYVVIRYGLILAFLI